MHQHLHVGVHARVCVFLLQGSTLHWEPFPEEWAPLGSPSLDENDVGFVRRLATWGGVGEEVGLSSVACLHEILFCTVHIPRFSVA